MIFAELLRFAAQQVQEFTVEKIPVVIVSSFFLYGIVNEVIRYNARIPGVPGPWGYWMFGNLPQLRSNAAQQYRKWAKKYGAVYQVQLGNIPVLVVNSASAAKVIFGQHSQATASRPELYTFHKVSLSNSAKTKVCANAGPRPSSYQTQPEPRLAQRPTMTR